MIFTLSINEFRLGEYIFAKFGIVSWSKGTYGFYYPGIITLIASVIFIKYLYILTRGINKKFILIIICIALGWKIIVIPIFDFGYGVIKSRQTGLACIDYIKKDSHVSYTTDLGRFNMSGNITLQNFGNTSKEFYVKIKTKGYCQKIGMPITMISVDSNGQPEKYHIAPKSSLTINLHFKKLKSKVDNNGGEWNNLDFIIYNKYAKEEFGRNEF